MISRLLIFAFIVMTASTFAQTPTIDAGVSQTLAKWRAANYSDVRYKLNLTLEKMSPVLKGTVETRVNLPNLPSFARGGYISIILDWRKIRGKEDLSTVSNVSLNGEPAEFEETNEHLNFTKGIKAGENVIKLDFTSPIATSGAATTRYVDKEDGAEYVYSLFVPSDASTAFPVFDQPDLKARFKLSVNIGGGRRRPNWLVVSNTKSEFIMNSTWSTLYTFEETKPISTYVFAFAAGEFEEFVEGNNESTGKLPREWWTENNRNEYNNHQKSRIYVRKSQAEKFKQHAAEIFRLNREGVKFLESYFDYKFPFPKYDLVLIPEFPFGGMEHAGATFLREDRVIFPTEPTKNDYITRANVIFHEAAHQWFGDTVTMRWFDDLWLKEGFAEFMAYKTLEKVMPEYNAWKIFYERNKQAAYLTDSTRGTTPIYQEIPNLSAAKSAYGNIVYRKAPSFLRQAEFYLGEDKFQTAVRAFLKKHEFKNAEWTDLVKEFETASKEDLKDWSNVWVKQRGLPIIRVSSREISSTGVNNSSSSKTYFLEQSNNFGFDGNWSENVKVLIVFKNEPPEIVDATIYSDVSASRFYSYENSNGKVTTSTNEKSGNKLHEISAIFPNYQDYGYGIFLLDEKSRAYVLENIQTEKDDFLRAMMWGALWDSVREGELAPKDYVELVIKNLELSEKLRRPIGVQPMPDGKPPIFPEQDESTISTLLNRVGTAMNYYLSDEQRKELAPKLEKALRDNMMSSFTPVGERITTFRALLNLASTAESRLLLKNILEVSRIKMKEQNLEPAKRNKNLIDVPPLRTKDHFDIVTKLLILSDENAPALLSELEKTETSDEAKRYAYAAKAGIATGENKAKFWNDFVANKEISESWIESAFVAFNSPKHADLTLPFLENALKELPNLKRNRKIFFVNGWLSAFIGGQKSEQALQIVNKFLTDNPNLDRDLRLKVLEVADGLERAVKIRKKSSDTK